MKTITICFLILALTGCAGSNGGTAQSAGTFPPETAVHNPAETAAAPAPQKNAEGFVFVYNGLNVYMDENMADVLAKLGPPLHEFEAPSCAFDGIDRIFSYPGVEIHTYPKAGQDYVHTVNYKDDTIATPEGIYLGSSLEDVLSAYGNDYEQELGQYRYTKGQTYLSFLADNDGMVIIITYGLVM